MEQWRFRVAVNSYVCADCGADMVFNEADGGLVMTHTTDCPQVAALRGASS